MPVPPPAAAAVVAALAAMPPPEALAPPRDRWELLLAAILSERAHPQTVAGVLAVLTEHFISPASLGRCDHRDLALALRALPLHLAKARAVVEAARAIQREHRGVTPASRAELLRLPGVSRAAAAQVALAHGEPAVVPTPEMRRVLQRLGWLANDAPAAAEEVLLQRLTPPQWGPVSLQLTAVGSRWCRRAQPRCGGCPLAACCPRLGVSAGRTPAPLPSSGTPPPPRP